MLARRLRDINSAEVKTVAYIPNQARSDAALIALACDEVVMNETAVLGGEGAATIDARQADAIETAWQQIMQENLKTLEALPLALVLPEYQVSRFVQQSTGRTEYFSASVLGLRKDRDSWKKQQDLAPGPLLIDGFQAEAYGLTEACELILWPCRSYGLGDDITY